MRRRLAAGACVLCGLITLSACAASETPREPLKSVALPDLSRTSEAVARQLRQAYDAFAQATEGSAIDAARRANAYGQFGQMLLAAKFLDEAASCFLNAQALAPDDPRWPYYLGHAYLTRLDRDRAAASFERALELAPADLATLLWLGEIRLDEGRPDAAAAIFKRARAVDSQSAAPAFGAGRAALMLEAHTEAVKHFEQALAVDPQASAVHYPLAMAYRALGDRQKAESHMRQRGEARPGWPDSLMQQVDERLDSVVTFERRGVQALLEKNWPAAAAAFRKGLELQPDDAALRHRLGTALFSAGDVAGAERELREVLQRSPNFIKAHVSLGIVLSSKGRYQEAIDEFASAVKADAANPDARLALAETLRVTGAARASLPHYEQLVKIDPARAEAWIGGARALIALKYYGAARMWLSDARRVHPERAELDELWAALSKR